MIKRYSPVEMSAVWSDENRYQRWLDVEITVCEAMAQKSLMPREALENIKKNARFNVGEIEEIEKTTKHDIIAFLTCVGRNVGNDARFIHMGLTSSDVLDTALALQFKEAGGIIGSDIAQLLALLKEKAYQHKETLMIGRSHGIHAEPITFGLKLAIWFQEMERNLARLERAIAGISYGKISGAVGTYSFVTPEIEEIACAKLGLSPAPVSSQIIQRDRHAEFFCALAIIASSIDKFAQEIRLLQRTEVREVEEFFSPGQKGSSAMPHKRNPILSENLSGLARLLRGYALSALENIPLWHERDISHSSVERVIAPDATIALDFMLRRFHTIVKRLVVHQKKMLANIDMTRGVIFSQLLMLKMVERRIPREDAYAVVQENALRSWDEGLDMKSLVKNDNRVLIALNPAEIDDVFDPKNFLKHIDHTFRRVFEK